MNPVVGVGGNCQTLSAALGDILLQQVAPGVVYVRVTPVFGFILQDGDGAVRTCVLRRQQTVQRVVGKSLVAAVGGVFVVDDSVNVAIVRAGPCRPVPGVEVIADGKDGRCLSRPVFLAICTVQLITRFPR